jgi:hypothetical protein
MHKFAMVADLAALSRLFRQKVSGVDDGSCKSFKTIVKT